MASQFSKNDIVRIILNTDRTIIREALTDGRLAEEVFLPKSEILAAIAAISGPISPEERSTELENILREFTRRALEPALRAAIKGRTDFETFGGFWNRLIAAINWPFEVILTHILTSVGAFEPSEPLFPFDSSDFGVPGPTPGPLPDNSDSLRALRSGLQAVVGIPPLLTSARTRLLELFLEIDPVFSLAQGPILGDLNAIGVARAQTEQAILDAIRILEG